MTTFIGKMRHALRRLCEHGGEGLQKIPSIVPNGGNLSRSELAHRLFAREPKRQQKKIKADGPVYGYAKIATLSPDLQALYNSNKKAFGRNWNQLCIEFSTGEEGEIYRMIMGDVAQTNNNNANINAPSPLPSASVAAAAGGGGGDVGGGGGGIEGIAAKPTNNNDAGIVATTNGANPLVAAGGGGGGDSAGDGGVGAIKLDGGGGGGDQALGVLNNNGADGTIASVARPRMVQNLLSHAAVTPAAGGGCDTPATGLLANDTTGLQIMGDIATAAAGAAGAAVAAKMLEVINKNDAKMNAKVDGVDAKVDGVVTTVSGLVVNVSTIQKDLDAIRLRQDQAEARSRPHDLTEVKTSLFPNDPVVEDTKTKSRSNIDDAPKTTDNSAKIKSIKIKADDVVVEEDTKRKANDDATSKTVKHEHQFAFDANEYEEEEENEWVRQEQEEAQRLHERGYCQRCIRHTVNREGGQPVKGCPSCDIKLCNGLLHI